MVTNSAAQADTNHGLQRRLMLWDLILYGIILVQPTAPMPPFGVIYTTAHGHVVTAILLAMVAMLFTSFSYGRMAQAYPQGGSAFLYVSKELHTGLGYVTGWCLILDYVLNPLICTIWCARAAINFLPHVPYPLMATFFAVLFTALNCRGVETSARINRGMAIALGLVILLIIAEAIHWLLQLNHPEPGFFTHPFYDPQTWNTSGLLRGTSIAVLTYIGFDGISTLSDEAVRPQRDIPRAIVLTCLVTGILSSLEVYLAQLIWPRGASFPDVDTAYVHVAQRLGGPILFLIVNGTLLLANMGSGLASQLGAARLLYAMGQDGALPRRFFAQVSSGARVPRNNVLLLGSIALIGALSFSYELGTELLNYGALLAFMGVNLAAAVRAIRSDARREWPSILFALGGLATCCFLWGNLGRLALSVGTIWAMGGILLYLVRRRHTHLP
ncbi:APC family permease [Silvibacterium dinghuense]|uniref:APC family permease n=1 Tax=Silvibacterium dinghuense TaxID=1560006 RepID=A0A4Q1SBZ5_9BACT|nr:APC family permease [Silvibacterium dinghuense]RXS94549.1 APC family permease [Silvibacterium dinghuense]GGH15427.1 putrescine/spermidine ABC transporter [Silvibacterium dinghuense]